MPYFRTDDNANLYYDAFGQGERTLLFIHGWLDSGESFRRAAGALSRQCRIIVYDQRGHGRSDAPAEGYNMTRLASDLRCLIELLELQNLTLVGYSMGAHVVYEYIRLFGEDGLDKLVITAMSPCLVNEKRPELSLGGGLTWRGALERLGATNRYFEENCKVAYLHYLRGHKPNEQLRNYYEAASHLSSGAMLRLELAMYAADYWGVLSAITRPTLVISSEEDFYPRAVHEEQARLIPNAKAIILPGCGHMLLYEQPEAYTQLLREFVSV